MTRNSNIPHWAVNILNLRKRFGLSQSAFGSMLHHSATAVSRWETGKLEPSARCYIQLGNLAGEWEGRSFWTRAGLKRSDLGHMSAGHPSNLQKRAWLDFEIVHAGSGSKRKNLREPQNRNWSPFLYWRCIQVRLDSKEASTRILQAPRRKR
jgi:DNA-binding XRE family transcriptional regulator